MTNIEPNVAVRRLDTRMPYRIQYVDANRDLIIVLPLTGQSVSPQIQALSTWLKLQSSGLLEPWDEAESKLREELLNIGLETNDRTYHFQYRIEAFCILETPNPNTSEKSSMKTIYMLMNPMTDVPIGFYSCDAPAHDYFEHRTIGEFEFDDPRDMEG